MKEIELKFWIFINDVLININKFILKLVIKNNEKTKKIFFDLYGYDPKEGS